MMRHYCDYCSGRHAQRVRRAAVLDYIRIHHNIPNTLVAEQLKVNRQSVVGWRLEAERRGCVPVRTLDGRAGWERSIRAKSATVPLAGVFPIGTLWTADETRRAA